VGSGAGLYRFDGLAFEHVEPEDFDNFRSRQVTALAVAKDGSLWVGYAFGGIAHLQDGRLRGANLGKKPRGRVTDIAAAPDGSVWVSAWSGFGSQLRHLVNGRWDVIDVDGPLQRMYLSRDGAVWIASYPNIHRLAPGSRTLTVVPGPVNLGPAFREDRKGTLWFYSSDGLLRLTPKGSSPARVKFGPMIGGSEGNRDLLFDADDLLWLSGDGAGLETVPGNDLRMDNAHTYPIRVSTLMRDREGIIWAGATDACIGSCAASWCVTRLFQACAQALPWARTDRFMWVPIRACFVSSMARRSLCCAQTSSTIFARCRAKVSTLSPPRTNIWSAVPSRRA
jgi:ligand-binding sensor domain-containing protein